MANIVIQGHIFYVGANGFLQEKKKLFPTPDSVYWEPGPLSNLNLPVTGNVSQPLQSGDPKNNWDGYRMAAVYSSNFHTGPGIRLFYHATQLDGTSFVQEMIWRQNNDSWSKGAVLSRPVPNSHLAATVDESTNILRVLFSSGDKTLSEEWIDISSSTTNYTSGMYPSLLRKAT